MLLEIIYFERIIKKPWKSQLSFFYWTQSLLMDKIIKNKRSMKLETNCSSGCKTSSENSFISYVLSDQIWWCNIKQFLSYSKNLICNFMQANSWHKLSHYHFFPFESINFGKEGKKVSKYMEYEKSFFCEIKNIFYCFWRAVIWWKNKLIKNSGHKL